MSERVSCSRYPVESAAAFTSVASPAHVARRATATHAATRLVIVIGLLAVVARLVFINQPYIDHWSWRQSDVATIARNFLQNGFRFASPQIDWAGNEAGYVGTEFPILPFIAALCYKFAGIHEWIGRIQAIIVFAVSLPFFFLLVREIFGSTSAVWATFFYCFTPLNVFAGRSFMPDVPSLSFGIVGLYFFLRWIQHGEFWSLFVAAITISLSLLIKVTSIVIFAPLAYALVVGRLCQTPGVSQKRPTIPGGIVFGGIALLPSAIWYWHAHRIAQQFYPHHFFGAGGIRIESLSWYWHIAQQTSTSSLTALLSVITIAGLFVPQSRHPNYSRLFHWWLAAMIVFIVVVGYGNRHRWYQLPLVPIAAALAGAACAFVGSKISSRFFRVTLSVLLVSSFTANAFRSIQPFYQSSAAQLRDAGLELKKLTAPDALIIAADMGDPTMFYYAERKGWHFLEQNAVYNGTPDDSRQAIENLERLRRNGATHFVFTRNTFWWLRSYPEFVAYLSMHAILIETTPQFSVYALTVR